MPEPDLLVTKLTAPLLRSILLERPHLLTALDQSHSFPLTVLAAPAGFGKTTLLAAWAGLSTGRVAWLTLDDHDNDPARFWAYVIAALRHSGSPVGEATLALLQAPHPAPLSGALTSLINELVALAEDTTLILDDYHLIGEPAIHESLQFVLDHRPPTLHLVLAGRGDPPLSLARLRARGQLLEIRQTDLRLRGDEAAAFLTHVMGLTLTADEIARLDTRTEGWIAGLQLAALALRRHPDVPAFIAAFAGSHRLILDYVHEEILEPLSEAQQRILLQTSVLTRMNAELCRALTGEAASQTILESLERANLFLVPLDEERRWYRWHALFREVLLARLQATQPEQVARLHREAALWYQRQDWLHEAMPHALAAQDFSLVAELLEAYTERLYLQGEIKTLLSWIKALPHEVVRSHPRLATTYILAFNLLVPFPQQQQEERQYLYHLRACVEQAMLGDDQTRLPPAERDLLHRRLIILDGWDLMARALSDGNVEQLHRLAEQAPYLAADDDAMWQPYLVAPFAMAWRMAGNFPPMVTALRESRKSTQVVHNRYLESQILWGLIVALIASGQLRQAHALRQELLRLVDSLGGPLPVAAYPDLFHAQLAYAWNQLDVAQCAAQQAIAKTAPLQYMDILMSAYEVLVRICLARGDLLGAEQAVQAMEELQDSAGIPIFRPWIDGLRVDLWLAQGHLTKAADWVASTSYRPEGLAYSREGISLALVRVHLAQQQYRQALALLAALLSDAEQVSRVGSMISILALQVAALQASDAPHDARRVLHRLLTLAEPEGYLRVFLDAGEPMHQVLQAILAAKSPLPPALAAHAHTVLAAFAGEWRQDVTQDIPALVTPARSPAMPSPAMPSPATLSPVAPSPATPPMLEPLTVREQEVLCLLAEGASNKEIARQLVVSLATAKKHVASILGKLGAENRTHAVARARSLALL